MKKKIVIPAIVVVLVALAGGGAYLWQRRADKAEPARTTSTAPSAQSDYSDGTERPQSDASKPANGGVKDSGKPVTTPSDSSSWTKSESGNITVYQPAVKALLRSGDTLSGQATVGNVSYRLIDDVRGVIAQGSLPVRDGKFSGTFDFSTSGSNGRLDVYSIDTSTLAERDNISLDVHFK